MPPLAEQELILSIASEHPREVGALSTWERWQRRFGACAGFEPSSRPGSLVLEGTFPIKHLWLRRHLTDKAQAEFAQRKALLPQLEETVTDFQPGAYERETRMLACRAEPYWLEVESDSAAWVARLERHPFFVPLLRSRYASGDHWVSGVIPLSLLTIRKTLPQARPLSEEEKQMLRDRLAAMRKR